VSIEIAQAVIAEAEPSPPQVPPTSPAEGPREPHTAMAFTGGALPPAAGQAKNDTSPATRPWACWFSRGDTRQTKTHSGARKSSEYVMRNKLALPSLQVCPRSKNQRRGKRRAAGKCEFCGKLGFLCPDGTRYVECHHIIALADEGADRMTNVIALCPGDHREAHFGERRDELEQQMIQRLAELQSIKNSHDSSYPSSH
jgi:hypothetical protein